MTIFTEWDWAHFIISYFSSTLGRSNQRASIPFISGEDLLSLEPGDLNLILARSRCYCVEYFFALLCSHPHGIFASHERIYEFGVGVVGAGAWRFRSFEKVDVLAFLRYYWSTCLPLAKLIWRESRWRAWRELRKYLSGEGRFWSPVAMVFLWECPKVDALWSLVDGSS